uniref:Putative peptidase M16 domain containing protein n=1 Tax=termite gut metagenome TaxID=433724 RepID=S0DFI7_9ZZZZ
MSEKNSISSARIKESYTKIDHASGLTMLLYPMQGFSSAYALFSTKYGSVDTCFKTNTDKDFLQVPEGIAHFLEHKLFESEDGDAFTRYAQTGASANAYTSFDRTAYLFSCTDKFKESLEILLDFVTKPYFTEQTVQKEQGIIGQEIKMYEDNPEWRVFFNLLLALYHEHPLRVDIVGTVDSIAKIDADILYRCYNTFYNLNNMVLCIAGNFSVDDVVATADRILKPARDLTIERRNKPEPRSVYKEKYEQNLPVAIPLFSVGFKADPATEAENAFNQLVDELLINIIAGESTPLYRKLYDEGLINSDFGGEAMSSRDYALTMFSGESRDPERVRDEIVAEISRIKREGIDPDVFSRCKKTVYGNYVSAFSKAESVASMMLSAYFSGTEIYRTLEMLAALTIEDAARRFNESFDVNRCALSVVKGE